MKWYLSLIVLLVILSLGTTNTVLAYRVMAADGLLGKAKLKLLMPFQENHVLANLHDPLKAL